MTTTPTTSPATPPATAAASPPRPAPVLNPKLIVPFVNSIRSVFSTMVGVAATVQRPYFKGHPSPTYDVSSIIGFSGEIIGCVVLSFQKAAALKLVEAFSGSACTIDNPDFADAIGELANMVAGNAKKDLGYLANISVPSVVIGADHVIAGQSDIPRVVIPCQTPFGEFAVEVNIRPASQAKAK